MEGNKVYEEIFEDYVCVKEVETQLLEKYKDYLPNEIMFIWEKYGFGTFMRGYLKMINPEEYMDLLQISYFAADKAIPIMVTAFGDIITWEEGRYMMLISIKEQEIYCLADGMKYIWEDMNDDYFTKKYFELKQYDKAVAKYGELAYDECFGYTPLLGMGGSKKIANLEKVKIKEHIELITAMMGRIE